MNRPKWTYNGYWHAVLGTRTEEAVVEDFELSDMPAAGHGSVDEWLGAAEAEAWRVGAEETGDGGEMPDEWTDFHARALATLQEAATKVRCECGRVTSIACQWYGLRSETVVIDFMPHYLRASHEAARNKGTYPENGAVRLRMHPECADDLREHNDGWVTDVV